MRCSGRSGAGWAAAWILPTPGLVSPDRIVRRLPDSHLLEFIPSIRHSTITGIISLAFLDINACGHCSGEARRNASMIVIVIPMDPVPGLQQSDLSGFFALR